MAVGSAARKGYRVARPLPEPPRWRRVSKTMRLVKRRDRLGRLLEEWITELRLGYTVPGE
jgi:hypothetical protein